MLSVNRVAHHAVVGGNGGLADRTCNLALHRADGLRRNHGPHPQANFRIRQGSAIGRPRERIVRRPHGDPHARRRPAGHPWTATAPEMHEWRSVSVDRLVALIVWNQCRRR